MMDDSCRQGNGKGFHLGSRRGGQSRLFLRAWIMLLVATALSVMAVGVTQADDQPLPTMTVGFQNGTITAINEKTFDIDGRTYGVTPDVVMLDAFGRTLDPTRLVVSAEVKFHVKKEQNYIIEKMIVTLPR